MPTIPEHDAPTGGFGDLGLDRAVLDALVRLGYEEPTPIQREAMPPMLSGRDVLGQAATGTGKTAAFALPVLQRVGGREAGDPAALILAPTRELALQVSEAVYNYGRELGTRVVPLVGGQPIGRQIDQLRRGVHVAVATPGRAVDHLRRGSLSLDALEVIVLDEADEMLDMGFADELDEILDATPKTRQTVLFSATLPRRIESIAARHQRDPARISIDRDTEQSGDLVTQRIHFVRRNDKAAALARVLDVEQPAAALVFCRTRNEVDELAVTLNGRGYRAEPLHGGMDQRERDRVMSRLRDSTAELLIATDVAARGIDVDTLTHVFNFDVPSAPESYVHRIGRVGRAGREGVAVTFAEPRERRLVANIERLTRQRIEVAPVPSVSELQAVRVDAVVEALLDGVTRDLSEVDEVLGRLAAVAAERRIDLDDRQIARAALALHAGELLDTSDERDIRVVAADDARRNERTTSRGTPRDKGVRGDRGNRSARQASADTGFVMVGLGRHAGIRPADLVGSIANECDIPGRDIGPIRIADKYAVVGVPESRVDDVVRTIHGAVIRGKRAKARRWVP